MVNYAIKRTTDGLFWDDGLQNFVSCLTEDVEWGTPRDVAEEWITLVRAGHRVDIIRVFKGKAIT